MRLCLVEAAGLVGIAALALAIAGCGDEAVDFCGGTSIEVRAPLSEPVTAAALQCDTGRLCELPTVVLSKRCDPSPQIAFESNWDNRSWLGVTLEVEGDAVVGAVAAFMSPSDDLSNPGTTSPVVSGWIQLYAGSLSDPANLSGRMDLELEPGKHIAGDFSALSNPPMP